MTGLIHNRRGFSLLEVMIVVLIMGIVTAQMFMVLTSQRRTFLVNEQSLNTQETARVVSDLVSFDARMAGFMVPLSSGVSSVDGGVNNSDRFCVSDPSFALTPLDGTPSPTMDNQGRKFNGVLGRLETVGSVSVPILDVDGDGTNDFAASGGIIITNGQEPGLPATRTFCDRITGIVPGGALGLLMNLSDNFTDPTVPVGTTITVVPAIVYEVDDVNMILARNGVQLSNSVEDLQIRYWVDSEIADGLLAGNEWPIDDLNNGAVWMDLTRVRRMQISIVSVGTFGEQMEGNQFNRRRRPAVANRAPGLFDDLPRRHFTVDVLPRNLL